jgi:hypothetical protein
MSAAEAIHSLVNLWADVPVRPQMPQRRLRMTDSASVTMSPWSNAAKSDYTLSCNITVDNVTSEADALLKLLDATEQAANSLHKILKNVAL